MKSIVPPARPIYHEMVNNGTYVDAMDNAWPYTLEWRAYYHAVVHHRNGESFSGDPFLDPVYDAHLYGHAYFHNRVLGRRRRRRERLLRRRRRRERLPNCARRQRTGMRESM